MESGKTSERRELWRQGISEQTFALLKAKLPAAEERVVELVLAQGERLLIPCEEAVLRTVLRVLRERR